MTNRDLLIAIFSCYPWTNEAMSRGFKPLFSAQKARARATLVLEDMAEIGCNWPIRSQIVDENRVLGYYEVPDTDFGKLNGEEADESQKASGIGLNWGSLIRLSKVCRLGREYFGSEWPGRFKSTLLDGKKHFSFIEEILWLGLWRGVTNVEYESRPFLSHGSKKRIDQRFDSCGQKINLEVKYRPKDWARHIDGPDHNIVMPGYFYDVPEKFRYRNEGELNLIGVTALASIDRSLRDRIQTLLTDHPTIDGVLVWAHASLGGTPTFEIHSTKKPLIEALFTGGDAEDNAHVGYVRHLFRKGEERRAYRPDEVPHLLRQLAAEERNLQQPLGSTTES